ncbi:serine/threonine-protein kinase [Mucilaginibacter gotjawali]|uniref:Serine/threonine-protein kinase PrkC n=2 Tax=Mucilaginibacter gotjawali TaxID=1550579 RepID=A0A0X8X3A5_9SPHI|nr:serine/threonine-protein kinase [Mucilaginibacter gotjawali]MBB3059163.1 serine/threonine-protein kinase [Mucilaginibacter gotjawali]BAU54934.1 Serine/threonine-protein kinase PrkC [Mucilaginibacter gotjawali]
MSKVFTIAEGLENMGALRTGGQGSVYKGRRIGPIISAVKLLPTPIHTESTDDKNYRNFVNEVDKLKKVNEVPNPNVVKILNSGITESGSFPFIEMEFIEGPDLEELLKPPHEAIFTIKETIKVADQLANALSHCHKVGVKHGDIKSNNVKFNIHSGNYVLLDFGLSAMSDEQRRSSMRHAGAIEFMAPEQNEGKMLFQTDVYSYGVILYELLAGQVPFPLKDNGETARNTVMIAHMELAVPDLLELRRQHLPENWTATQKEREMQVPAWLLDLIADCLEKSPEKRYKNGMQLQEAIIENSIADIKTGKGNNSKVNQAAIGEVAPPVSAASYTPPPDTGMINLSKPVFYGFMVLLFVFMGLAGYSLFSKSAVPANPVTKTVVDTPKTIDSEQVANEYYTRKHREKQKLVDSTTLNAIRDAQMRRESNPDSAATDTSNKQNN